MDVTKPVRRRKYDGYGYRVSISNLKGGHSGCDIALSRSNANKLLVRLLRSLKYPVICDIYGGDKSNAIPHSSSVTILFDDVKLLKEKANDLRKHVIKNSKDDDTVVINVKKVRVKSSLTKKDSENVIKLLRDIKNGVLESNCNHFPLTSQNLAKIALNDDLYICVSLRSSIVKYEDDYVQLLNDVASKYNACVKITSKAPFFEERKDSYLVDVCKKTYKELYGVDITSGPVHAGLEGGVFAQNIKNADICVMAVELMDIHSTTEKASISSLERVENWVEKILEEY
jgi:dipeptidase D